MAMKPGISHAPRYCHLLEVLDGAASLHAAIRNAEAALRDQDLDPRERSLLESVLEVSRERQEHVRAILAAPGEVPDRTLGDREEDAADETGLVEAGRAARSGDEDAERYVCRALDRIARSMDTSARDAVESFLAHDAPALRASAMKVLAMHWRLAEYTDRILWTLACDEESECRRVAALCLGSLFEGTRDRGIGRELAGMVAAGDEEPDVRWASYWALLAIDGAEAAVRPLPTEDFEVPRDADTDLLARYADPA